MPTDPRVARFEKLPDWRGYWIAEGMLSDISGYTADGPTAPLRHGIPGRRCAVETRAAQEDRSHGARD